MKRCKSLIALFLALSASGAKAQYTETFTQAKLGPAWSFVNSGSTIFYSIPGNASGNTEDSNLYSITGGAMTINQQGGGFAYGRNAPTVTIAANAPGDYDIRVTVALDLTATAYPSAGLVIAKDANNFFQLCSKHNGGSGTTYANSYLQSGGNPVGGYDNFATYGDVGSGPVVYHINKTGTTIILSFTPSGGAETVLGTVTAADTDPYKAAVYAFLTDLSGLHVGLFDDNYDGSFSAPAVFTAFSTSLPVVLPTTTDSFAGPKLSPLWSFVFPGGWNGNNGTNEDASAYTVGDGAYVVTATNSGLYGNNSYIRNLPSVTVTPTAPGGDYDIEIAADGTFNYPLASEANQYPNYGLILFTDASNYFTLGVKHTGYPDANGLPQNRNYANTTLRIGDTQVGNYDNFASYANTGIGPVLYRVKKTGTTITFSYTKPGDVETTMGTVSAADTDPYNAGVYSFLSNMAGKHIGMYVDPSFDGNIKEPVAFSRFYTTLPLVTAPVPVTGNIALEGVADLFAIDAAAPLGTFHISFRTPGSLVEKYGFDVTPTTVAGSANGAYSVNVLPGTYDVWIKGAKNLAVLNPNVVVGVASGIVPDSLLGAGDSDNNNTVDVLDFGNLVNSYGSKASDPNSGYDPTVDFDFNGAVDVLDFGDLVNEYGIKGPK